MNRTVTATPADKKTGLTLADLAAFIAEANKLGIPDDTKVYTTVGFRDQITKAEVTG